MNRRSGIGGVGPAVGSMVVGSEKGFFFVWCRGSVAVGWWRCCLHWDGCETASLPYLLGALTLLYNYRCTDSYCYCNNFIHTNHGGPLQKQEADRPLLTHSKLHCSQCPVTKYASLTTPFITNKPHAWTEYAGTK